MPSGVTDSQFHMWRTLFAITHADNVVTNEEIRFMAHVLEDIEFSDKQTEQLKDDISNPKDAEAMFRGVTDPDDRIKFFDFARDLVWVDGDFASEEQNVLIKLMKMNCDEIDIEKMVGKVSLELEAESYEPLRTKTEETEQGLFAFSRRFRRWIGG
ncbi:MAG: TerB family tellurite resistance protein [Alphaproteobacteria bacterium]|nr:TerB family tellurite resistance protein [Alphaproteobacteria bacterium]